MLTTALTIVLVIEVALMLIFVIGTMVQFAQTAKEKKNLRRMAKELEASVSELEDEKKRFLMFMTQFAPPDVMQALIDSLNKEE